MNILSFPILNKKLKNPISISSNRSGLICRQQYNQTVSLSTLSKDTVSFGALKKTQFEGIDFAVVEKFKAPIEKFKTNDDLQNWAKEQTDVIVNKDFGGRQKETKIQRKAMLKEWVDYVTKENDAYSSTMALLILSSVTKGLKPDNDKLPPVLNKGVLADCISEIDKNIKADKKYLFDLNNMYETKMRALYLEDTKTEGGNTGWVVIPSEFHNHENFEENVEKLKTLSHKNWCTKSFNAKPYLSQGDFHVYLENGQPKLGVRFVYDKIQEIQGELNNGKIPFSYFGEAKKHIAENNLKLTGNAESEVEDAEELSIKAEKIKNDLKSAIETNDVKTILEYFGVNVKQDDDGMLTISHYEEPNNEISFADLGINENNLFKKINCIEGYAYLYNSQVTNLGNLQSIGGYADFYKSQVTDLGNLQSIEGDTAFGNSKVTNLGNLQSIGGYADFSKSQVTDLGNLQSIGGDVYFSNSQITDLGNLRSIGRDAFFSDSLITDLGNLQSIGGDTFFKNSQVTNLGNLQSIGGDAYFNGSQVTDLGNLQSIGGFVHLQNSLLTANDFKNIKVKGYIE